MNFIESQHFRPRLREAVATSRRGSGGEVAGAAVCKGCCVEGRRCGGGGMRCGRAVGWSGGVKESLCDRMAVWRVGGVTEKLNTILTPLFVQQEEDPREFHVKQPQQL